MDKIPEDIKQAFDYWAKEYKIEKNLNELLCACFIHGVLTGTNRTLSEINKKGK